ncbi:hypothetical protein DFS33DRAFT_1387475 [Desarmillaria ectypa]|nr:hypothetical protein DFS33DRAFT_1387475 [Desarmillaria ectypa]
MEMLRVLLGLLTIGWWSHVVDVWGRKVIMLISIFGTTFSDLVFVLLQQAGLLRKDFHVYVGIIALDFLFGSSIAFSGLLHTFKLFSALKGLKGLSILFYVRGAQPTILPLMLTEQKYLILAMIISSFVAVINIVLILWLLLETLRSPDHKLPILKAVISLQRWYSYSDHDWL